MPAVVRAAAHRIRNAGRSLVTLRTLINLCALQGVSIHEMLLDPVGASSRPLIDLWSGYQSLEFPNGRHAAKITAYRACLEEVMKRCAGLYLPSTQFLMREIKLNRDLARELSVDLYEAYEGAHQSQGSETERIHAERAFRNAMDFFNAPGFNPFVPCDIQKIVRRVALSANVPREQAKSITRAALYSRRALERAKAKMFDLPMLETGESSWLRSPA